MVKKYFDLIVPKNVAIRHSIEQHSLAQILIDLNYSNSRATIDDQNS
jgi:hypothetical protein